MGEGGSESEYGAGHMAFEGSKGHESTPAMAKLKYAMRKMFPNMPIAGWRDGDDEKLVKEWAWVLAPKNAKEQIIETKNLSFSEPMYGRADFIPMVFESEDGTRFCLMYRRGVGGANARAGDFNGEHYGIPWKGELGAMGFGDSYPTLVEAEQRSMLLHKKGIRVRLPIMGFEIDGVYTKDGYKTIKDLVDTGVLDPDFLVNKPVESYWAKRNSYTFWDAMKVKDVDGLLKSQIVSLRCEKDLYADKVIADIESGKGETGWFNWMIDKGAEQAVIYAQEGFIHPSFTGQNIDLSIETGDLVSHEHGFEMRPLSGGSSESDKYMFCEQARSMLANIIELKEHFISERHLDIYRSNGVVKKMIERYVLAISKADVGVMMIDHLLSNQNDIPDFATQLSVREMFVNELKRTKWRMELVRKIKSILP